MKHRNQSHWREYETVRQDAYVFAMYVCGMTLEDPLAVTVQMTTAELVLMHTELFKATICDDLREENLKSIAGKS